MPPITTHPSGSTGMNTGNEDAAIDGRDDGATAAYWDDRYGESERMWSGRPNAALVAVVESLQHRDRPGTALDLGCGEGADTVWLAQQGWRATGVDISETAIARAETAAQSVETSPGTTEFVAADLTEWDDDRAFDLVAASFLHSPMSFPRADVLRRAAERVRAGGHLVIISHATMPPWAEARHEREDHGDDQHEQADHQPDRHGHVFLSADEETTQLALDPDEWTLVVGEARDREAVGPDGERAVLQDTVIVMQRAAEDAA